MSAGETTNIEEQDVCEFLVRTAELLHRYGTPSYRLEAVVKKVARSLGVSSVILYTPTALVISLETDSGENTWLRRIESGEIDISKVLEFDRILEDLQSGQLTLDQASLRLEEAANAKSRFNRLTTLIASAVACAGISVVFGGNQFDAGVAGVFGFMIAWSATWLESPLQEQGFLEPLLGFTAAVFAVIVSQWLPINDRLVTLSALILPIPGLTLTIAFTEIATGHLSSGSARFAGAAVKLLTLVVGVAIAWRITAGLVQPLPPVESLPMWCLWVALAITPLAFGVVLRVPLAQWFAVVVVVVGGFVVARYCGDFSGTELGAFAGAFTVGCGSNIYARVFNRPAMVPQTPGLLILVPGSLGYKSLTAMLESDTLKGVELAFAMTMIAVSLVTGLLLANQVVSPKRIL